MRIRLKALVLLLPALLAIPALGEVRQEWTSGGIGLLDAIADDLDRDGVLEILGIKGGNILIVDGSNGEERDHLGRLTRPPRVADLDGDGIMEIAVALEAPFATSANDTQLKIYKKEWLSWGNYFNEKGKNSIVQAIADVDNDGKYEIVGSPQGTQLRVYNADPVTQVWSRDLGAQRQAALGDFDGDGITDIAAVRMVFSPDGEFSTHVRDIEMRYDLNLVALRGSDGEVMLEIPKMGSWSRVPITADTSGLGRDDILLFHNNGFALLRGRDTVFEIKKDGGFFGGAVGNIFAGPDPEIILVDNEGNIKALDGSGNKIWESSVGKPSGQPIIADVNDDAAQEVLVPTEAGRIVVLKSSDGSEDSTISTGEKPKHLIAADFDGDGKMDILVNSDSGLELYETGSKGDIEWATECGDAQATYSYRLSRAYIARVRDPSALKPFPWTTVYIFAGAIVLLGIIGLLILRGWKAAEKVVEPTADAKGVVELEREYHKNRDNKLVIRKLAMEYANRNITDLKAIEIYQKALALAPDHPIVTKALASAYLIRNVLNSESEAVFRRAAQIAPDDQRLLAGLVTLYSQNKRTDPEALKIYEKFYYLGLENPRATTLISRELAKQKSDEPFAVHLYQRQLKHEPADPDVLPAMLDYQRRMENAGEYLSWASPALQSPNITHGLSLRIAEDLVNWEHFDDAELILRKAVTAKADDVEAWWLLKESFKRSGRGTEAIEATNRLVQIYTDLQRANPTLADFKIALAKLYRELGDHGAAVGQLSTIAKMDPVYPEAAMMLTESYVEIGELDKATTVFESVPGADTKHPDLMKKIEELRSSKIFAASAADDGRTAIMSDERTLVEKSMPQRYKIIGELGRGGMGVVYKAVDTVLNREVAYKILPEDLRNHPQIAKSFEREAQSLAALSHPNIVTVFDAGQQAGTLFFVMQYIEGTDLKQTLKTSGKLPMSKVLEISKQLCRALAYAHEKRIIHRDIKTSNVMLTKDGSVMLMDFGLSKVIHDAAAGKTMVAGTPYYMSPEQTIGEGVDHRTDIYSFGVMLFELLVGRVPFPAGDIGYHHIHTQPESPSALDPSIPEPLSSIVLKCLEKDKEMRYQSASEILNDLERI